MTTCVFRYCKNTSRNVDKTSGVSFHRFVHSGHSKREEWMKIVRKDRSEDTWLPKNYSMVCSAHFRAHDIYTTKAGKRFLKDSAVPRSNPSEYVEEDSQASPTSYEEMQISDSESVNDTPEKNTLQQGLRKVSAPKMLPNKILKLQQQNKYLRKKTGSLTTIVKKLRRRLQWLNLMSREDLIKNSDQRVCEVNFNKQDANVKNTRKILKKNSLPCSRLPSIREPAKSQKKKEKNNEKYNPFEEFANDSTDEESLDIKQESSEEDKIDESEAPVTEQVFLKSVSYKNKRLEDCEKPSKRARLDTFEVPLDEYTKELYEFGKFVAEQLMCFDVEDARVAQAEIRALLSKFDVNKIMRCMAEPSTSNVQPTTYKHRTVVTQAVTQRDPAVLPVPQSTSKANTARLSLTQPVISHVYSTNPQGKLKMSMDADGPSATQSGSQVNTPGPSGDKSGLILSSPFTKLKVLNVDTSASSSASIGYVIVPTATGSSLNLTGPRGSTEGTKSKPTSVTQVGSSIVKSAGTDLQPEHESASSSMIFDVSSVKIEPESESLHSHVNVILPNLSDNQNSLAVKQEQDSEEET